MIYEPKGVCSREFRFTITDGKLTALEIDGGCNGNLKGIKALVIGMEAAEVIKRLRGIRCDNKSTSCPDQLARALEIALKKGLS